jgi:hypothetical protein
MLSLHCEQVFESLNNEHFSLLLSFVIFFYSKSKYSKPVFWVTALSLYMNICTWLLMHATFESKTKPGQALVAHTCNPSYSEAEIRRIKVKSQLWQIVFKTQSRKKPITKKGLVEWLMV